MKNTELVMTLMAIIKIYNLNSKLNKNCKTSTNSEDNHRTATYKKMSTQEDFKHNTNIPIYCKLVLYHNFSF